jgi:hypothetical protein
MQTSFAYRVLCGAIGIAFVGFGLVSFASFFAFHAPDSDLPIPTGPTGFYFVAFTGCALVGWGGSLVASLRDAATARTVGSVTAFSLVLMAVYRMAGWVVGDYYVWVGDLIRSEAILFLLLALALVWLRPRPVEAEPATTPVEGAGA